MTEEAHVPLRPRLVDFLKPSRLFAALDQAPTFILPILLLSFAALFYTQFAFDRAFPLVSQELLRQATVTESELRNNFRGMLLVGSFLVPLLSIFLLSAVSYLLLLFARARQPFSLVTSLFAWSSLWVTIGLLVKAALVSATGSPDPAVNLGLLFRPETPALRAIYALSNPFVILAAVWTVRGLQSWSGSKVAGWLGGALPWLGTAALLALSTGDTRQVRPAAPVDTSEYKIIENGTVTLHFPPRLKRTQGETVAAYLEGVGKRLSEKFEFEREPVTVVAYPDHATLERATGEFLHVQVIGSIRGRDLLYVEMPGHSAALTTQYAMSEVLRYGAIMQLAPVLNDAPRWFVEGLAHATVHQGGVALNNRYLDALRRLGAPSYEDMLDPMLFLTPEGPLLARGMVDHIAMFYERAALEDMVRDLVKGESFRDALYSRTRLTTTAFESGWQDHMATLLSIDQEQRDGIDGTQPDATEAGVDASTGGASGE